jgi:hypothetical protein
MDAPTQQSAHDHLALAGEVVVPRTWDQLTLELWEACKDGATLMPPDDGREWYAGCQVLTPPR